MRLQQQETLYFQNDTSDKVYEVDLCEVTGGMYLVNFRYGRRTKPLREGTKTDKPVSLDTAQKIFNKLVAEKTKKGYNSSSLSSSTITSSVPEPIDTSLSTEEPEKLAPFNFELNPARKTAILKAIQEIIDKIGQSGSKQGSSMWNTFKDIIQNPAQTNNQARSKSSFPKSNSGRTIERLIWRVGELRLKAAVPLLNNINPSKNNALLKYNLVWAIGRCGDPTGMSKLE